MHRIDGLESLRGLMALWVMLGHIYLTLPGEPSGLIGRVLKHNGMAVDVFIILSGFVIFGLLDRERGGFVPYITRRFFRIYPVYLVLLLASVAIMPVAEAALSDPAWQSPRNASRLRILSEGAAYLPQHLAAHLTLTHGLIPSRWLPSSEYALLGQAWSISLEWQFYMVAPLCFWAVERYKVAGAALVLGVTIAAHFALRRFAGEGFLPNAAPYFVLGAASWYAWKSTPRLPPVAIGAGVALSLMLCPVPVAIWVAVLGALLLRRTAPDFAPAAWIAAALESRPLIWLGTISYSLYLVHVIPIAVAVWLMPDAVAELGLRGPYLFATVTATSLALSWITYTLIERPGIRLGRVVAGRPSPAASFPTTGIRLEPSRPPGSSAG